MLERPSIKQERIALEQERYQEECNLQVQEQEQLSSVAHLHSRVQEVDPSARRIAAELRQQEPLLAMRPRTTRDDPNFMNTFFKASRLHFIGTWKA
eukprot:CAMPEP_0197854544 /NCGR_PEP_ID=MMETSP1438-20131217/24870_1 /TAXON_ID=1461541 /ORGANISM="Pterosperma sp., Strain CCMP1384" /LENGTH=95 /DNA_ID=CAMNT_0043469315 /DNA_START=180 /DNA_END=464 /DNA_ORIENTATION=+